MRKTYICEICGGEFEIPDDWSDIDAIEEAVNNGAAEDPEGVAIVCDDCFRKTLWGGSDETTEPLDINLN